MIKVMRLLIWVIYQFNFIKKTKTGWLVKVKVDNVADVDSLMSEDQYKEYLKTADH